MTIDQLQQALVAYSTSDPGGGRALKVDVTAVTADTVIAEGTDSDGDAITNDAPVLIGAKAVDTAVYAPAYAANDAAMLAVDKDNGGLLVNQADLNYAEDSVTAYGTTVIVSSTVTMSVAGAYSSGDYMGTSTTPQAFSNAVRVSGGTGVIKSLIISDKIATANVAMELWLFSATFTAPTDNAAWAISDAEALTVLGVIPISTTTNSSKPGWFTSSNNQVYVDDTLSIPIKPAATSLYYALVARGTTPSFTSLDLTLNLGILLD